MRIVALFLGLLLAAVSHGARAEKIYLTSLEWPPYAGQALPDRGASVAVVQAAFAAMGHELVVEFLPWTRAVRAARESDRVIGYFPEYYSANVARDFVYSKPIGNSPLGLVEHASRPISWTRTEDLSGYVIGVVQGYVNTGEFDALVAARRIRTEGVGSDSANVLKVASGRVDAAVIDRNVLEYLLAHDERARTVSAQVRFGPSLLEQREVYVCFRNDVQGQRWQRIFDQGLARIDAAGIIAQHMQ